MNRFDVHLFAVTLRAFALRVGLRPQGSRCAPLLTQG